MTEPGEQDQPPWLICGMQVGANRCRLRPHYFGRHDVAPDYLLDAYRVGPVPERLLREVPVDALAEATKAAHQMWGSTACPATGRVCSCRPGERCSPAVERPRDGNPFQIPPRYGAS